MAPLGYKPRFINSTLAVLIAYIANLGIPRSGEILRATTLSSYEKIPFEKTFGTIIAERLVDLIILLGFILIALTLQFDLIWGILKEKQIATNTLIFSGLSLIVVFFIIRLLFKQEKYLFITKIKTFMKGLLEGVLSLRLLFRGQST